MYVKNRLAAFVFRAISTCVAIAGILAIMWIGGRFSPSALMFYTLISNIAVLAYFVVCALRTFQDLKNEGPLGEVSYFPKLSMFLAVDILLTLLVYWVMLAPRAFDMGGNFPVFSFANITVHTVTPLLMIVDYVIFNRRRVLKPYHAFFVLILPLAYAIFALVLGQLGYVFLVNAQGEPMHAPYFFLEVDKLGWFVIVYIAGIMAGLLCFGFLGYLIDRKASDRTRECRRQSSSK